MKNKTQFVCTIAMLAAAIACFAVNFTNAWAGNKADTINITATAFFVLFWLLMMRFKPAAKISSLLSLYTFVASVVGVMAIAGDWGGFVTSVLTAPACALFYGLRVIDSFAIFYIVSAIISFVILIFSLINLVNGTPKTK